MFLDEFSRPMDFDLFPDGSVIRRCSTEYICKIPDGYDSELFVFGGRVWIAGSEVLPMWLDEESECFVELEI
tara:strand:- start:92 stop:307 length:216 start_codon:yes stop_codon:yes gene_type:complete